MIFPPRHEDVCGAGVWFLLEGLLFNVSGFNHVKSEKKTLLVFDIK